MKMLWKRAWWLLILVAALFIWNSQGAQSAPPEPDVKELTTKVKEQGAIRLIVGLDVSFQPEGEITTQEAIRQQRNRIEQAQDNLLRNLAGQNMAAVARFETIPYLGLEVDADGLAVLLADPDLVSIQEDVPVPATLSGSIPLIGADDAWTAGYAGSGQAVAILDTGVDKSHPFVAGRIISEACYSTNASSYNASSVCPNGQEAQTGSGAGVNCATSIEGCDHGTHVAGIAAGNGSTFDGVAREANLIAVQVFSRFYDSFGKNYCGNNGHSSPCALTFTSDQILGLERIYALRPTYDIAAINMSLGGGNYTSPCDSDSRKAIIDNLRSAGIATVVSSGNSGYTNAIGAPACISSAISVGSTTDSDTVSSFSNSASILDLLAPGSSIYSAVPGGTFGTKSGTSMAAPHVTGAWAILKSKQPGAGVSEILQALVDTGQPVTDSRNGITRPRIQVDAALGNLVSGDGYEPDDTAAEANTISDGSPQTGHSILPVGDEDWVKFTLSAEAAVTLETSGGSGDTQMWLYDNSITELDYDDDDGSGLFSYLQRTCGGDALPAGSYYVRVREYANNDSIPDYSLSFTVDQLCTGGNPALAYSSRTIDDDNDSGNSSGNDDGVANCGETVEMFVSLANQGDGTALNVTGEISGTDPYIAWLYNTTSGYPDILPAEAEQNTNDFDFEIDPATPDGYTLQFTLDITAGNGGPWSETFTVPVVCSGQHAPNEPANPSPPAGATDVTRNSGLGWSGGDPDAGDAVTYDVYFAPSGSSLSLICYNTTSPACNPGLLSSYTAYNWQVVAHDSSGNDTIGPVWSFTTGAAIGTPDLTYDAYFVDDDNDGNSSGNDDSIADCGETVELFVNLANNGSGTALTVTSIISSPDPYLTWLYNTSSSHPDIVANGSEDNTNDFDFEIAANTPNNHSFEFDLYTYAYNEAVKLHHFTVPVSCSTLNQPPNTPANPIPADGLTAASRSLNLRWTGGDPDPADSVTYDVYFGPSGSPSLSLICDDTASLSCSPGPLAANTGYDWQVVAYDSKGVSTNGSLWSFTTAQTDTLPGDCNGDQQVDAGDAPALILEIADTDGDNPADVANDTAYPGDPVGCNPNQDTLVNNDDIYCLGRLIFVGPEACSLGGSAATDGDQFLVLRPASAGSAGLLPSATLSPTLDIPDQISATAGSRATFPIVLSDPGDALGSLAFSIDYDETWLSFNDADIDSDGFPDAIQFDLPSDFGGLIRINPGDPDGELDFLLTDMSVPLSSSLATHPVSLTLETGFPANPPLEAAVDFSQGPAVTFGDKAGRSIGGVVYDGSVLILPGGTLYLPLILK